MASTVLATVAKGPARAFRVMMKTLTGKFHIEQAQQLLLHRSSTGLELLADDVNVVLSHCVTGPLDSALHAFLATAKRKDALVGRPIKDLIEDATSAFSAWDHGPYLDLEAAVVRRDNDAAGQGGKQVWGAGQSSGKVLPAKRPREAEGEAGAGSSAPPINSFEGGGTAIGDAYKRAFEALKDVLYGQGSEPHGGPGRWARARFDRALRVFGSMEHGSTALVATGSAGASSSSSSASSDGSPSLRVKPNARSYVLMLYGALQAGLDEEGRRLLAALTDPTHGPCPTARLYEVLQPSMLVAMWRRGWLDQDTVQGLLCPQPNTRHWAFLKAAWEACKGDQFGSKHGAVVADKDWGYLSHGRNHRFGVPGDPHVRVMHSEVHALIRLMEQRHGHGSPPRLTSTSVPSALDVHVIIVELDGAGVGYEVATPCAMCSKGLCRVGAGSAVFSSHAGLTSSNVHFKPALECESMEMARARVYPDGTQDPDTTDSPGFAFWETLSQDGAGPELDPGRGRTFAEARAKAKAVGAGSSAAQVAEEPSSGGGSGSGDGRHSVADPKPSA